MKPTIIAMAISLFVAPMSAQGQDGPPMFYDMANDSSSMMLLGLSSIEGKDANTTFIVVNLFRGSTKNGVINTWRANCTNGTMQIVKGMAFTPNSSGKPIPLKSEIVRASATPVSRTMYKLVCTGEGNLQEARTYKDELPVIIKRFWR